MPHLHPRLPATAAVRTERVERVLSDASRKLGGLAVALAAATTIAAGSAHAGFPPTTVPDAVIYTNIALAPSLCTFSGGGCVLGTGGALAAAGTGYSFAALADNGDPSIQMTGTGEPSAPIGYQGGGGDTYFYYYYSVAGPVDTYVPVTITGGVSANGSGYYAATATINYANGGFDTLGAGSITVDSNSGGNPIYMGPQAANLNTTYDVLTNTPLLITLDLFADGSEFGGQGEAEADPRLSLSSAEVAAGDFITLSPNLAGGVPEPAAWAMMLLGFGGAGAAMRRRRGKSFRKNEASPQRLRRVVRNGACAMRLMLGIALTAMLAVATGAGAASLYGDQVDTLLLYPYQSTIDADLGVVTAGPAIEYPNIDGQINQQLDITASQVVYTLVSPSNALVAPFNGFEFTDLTHPFTSATLDGATTLTGMTLSFAGGNIFLNVAGVAGTTGDNITIDVTNGSAVPEPFTWMLMLTGIGGVGAIMRKARRTSMASFLSV